jgi:putative resolvase
MNKSEYLSAIKIKERYDVSIPTLRRWVDDGILECVRLPGGKRLYARRDVDKIFGKDEDKQKTKVCYARVSSQHQKGDLERQIQDLQREYPSHEVLSDIGSGLNYKRKHFKALLERVYSGDIEEVCITHKDRLCRYGFELLEFVFQKAGTRIVVLDKDPEDKDSTKELADDLLSVVNFFVARNNGLRAGKKRKRRKQDEEETKIRKTTSREDEEGTVVSNPDSERDSE